MELECGSKNVAFFPPFRSLQDPMMYKQNFRHFAKHFLVCVPQKKEVNNDDMISFHFWIKYSFTIKGQKVQLAQLTLNKL